MSALPAPPSRRQHRLGLFPSTRLPQIDRIAITVRIHECRARLREITETIEEACENAAVSALRRGHVTRDRFAWNRTAWNRYLDEVVAQAAQFEPEMTRLARTANHLQRLLDLLDSLNQSIGPG